MKKFLCVVGILVVLVRMKGMVEAVDLYVPGIYTTIQAAINAASNGDTVLVSDGRYTENINFSGKAITVISVNGTTSIIIDGNASGSVVTFKSGEGTKSVLSGFTIRNGSATFGGGIYCYNSSPTITNCTISGNSAGWDGGGILGTSSSSPTILNSILWEDTPEEIYLSNTSSINITYSAIKGGYVGVGNINADPVFVGGGDYHLQSTSPCINKGTNTPSGGLPSTDKDGNPKIINGLVDIGTYEFGIPTEAISSITHRATTPLGIGAKLIVTMQGQAGGFATFTIAGMATTTMTGVNGTYTGTYTIQQGDNIINGTITGYLIVNGTTYTKDANTSVTLDGILPTSTASALAEYSETSSIKIPYTAFDNLGLKQISLYKMKEGGTWTHHHTYSISGSPTTYTGTLTCNLGADTDGLWFFYTKVKDIAGNVETFTGSDTKTIVDTITPVTPTLISVTDPAQDGKLNLSWTPGTDTNLSEYKIHYGTESERYTNVVNTGSTTTTYHLSGLTNDIAYYIAVSADDKAGNESGKSNELSGTPTFGIPVSTILKITPATQNVGVNSTFTVSVEIKDVEQFTGADVHIRFNPNILEMIEIGTGTFPLNGSEKYVVMDYNNSIGWILYGVGLGTGGFASGSGRLCNLTFRAKQVGTCSVVFEFDSNNNHLTRLRKVGREDIPFTKEEALYTVQAVRQSGNIAGFCMLDWGAETFGTSSDIQVRIVELSTTTTTNNKSEFIFENIPVGTYTLTFDTWGAAPATKTNICFTPTQVEDTTYIGTITLLGGDASNDGAVNSADWPVLAAGWQIAATSTMTNWEGYFREGDFNHSRQVNILDYEILRDNFGKLQEGRAKKLATRPTNSEEGIALSFDLNTLEGVDINDLQMGNIIYLKVSIHNAKNFLCGEIHLSFNPKVLEVVNAPVPFAMMPASMIRRLPAVNGEVRIQPGTYTTGKAWELINKVDNKSGKIDYAVGLLEPQTEDGGGVLAIVPFKVIACGDSSKIDFKFEDEENRQTMFTKRIKSPTEGEIPVDVQIDEVATDEVTITVPPVFNLKEVKVYPNPAYKNKVGHEKVTFTNLTTNSQVTLRIYTIAGELVFEDQKAKGNSELKWNLQNKDNEYVASGIYIYFLIDENGSTQKGKIGVLK